ncbi:SPOR domain-containing protein [Paenibacillus lutrae]|uniref:Sporulation and cell division repeat protein n=1 Tax=Paenibacillus lutrae TaxID=2078573 RepID=A0A7X3JZ81_9BACL|nr:SPOR domain-containing protein [Paenibacillus lutrae]MVO99690.1 sporulation and cell division repeat protein [Paenibacillus lutrae]
MNKARITYRMDDGDDRPEHKDHRSGSKIIPLTREEFSVSETLWREDNTASPDAGGGHRGAKTGKHRREPADEYEGLNEFTSDFGSWQSPFDEETERIARLIRESNPADQGTQDHGRGRTPTSVEKPGLSGNKDPVSMGERDEYAAGDRKPEFGTYEWEMEQNYRDGSEPVSSRQEASHTQDRIEGSSRGAAPDFIYPVKEKKIREENTELAPSYPPEAVDEDHEPDSYRGNRRDLQLEKHELHKEGHRRPVPYEEVQERGPVYEDPYNRLHWDEPGTGGVRYARSGDRGGWLKVATSVAGALVTGAAFGYFVLSMFSGNGEKPISIDVGQSAVVTSQPDSGVTTPTQKPEDPAALPGVTAPAVGGAGTALTPVGGSSAAVSIPARSYTVLQHGIFSTPQSAETARSDARSKGAAAVAEPGAKTTVYVGVAGSKEDAAKLKNALAARKVEVFAKPLDLPAVGKVFWKSGSAQPLADYLAQGAKLAGMAGSLSAAELAEAAPGALDAASLQQLTAARSTWASLQPAVGAGIPDAAKPQIDAMNAALGRAVAKLGDYAKAPAAGLLAEAQEALMQYVITEKQLMKLLTASSA